MKVSIFPNSMDQMENISTGEDFKMDIQILCRAVSLELGEKFSQI